MVKIHEYCLINEGRDFEACDTNKNYGDYVISIDELEKRTGIDFFCNLPDDVEKTVEAETDLNFWKLTTTP